MSATDPDAGKVRRKMDVGEGRSLMHWSNLKTDVKRIGKIKMSEIEKHRTQDDCWTAYRGRVYDMTPFMEYHPGGVKYIMSAAGKDGTKLFNKFHAWVNIDYLLDKCLIGKLVGEDGKDITEEVVEEESETESSEEDEEDEYERMARENAARNAGKNAAVPATVVSSNMDGLD